MLEIFCPQFFLSPAQRRLFKRGVPVFTYHGVGSPPPGAHDPFLHVETERFDGQLQQLRDGGFSSGTLDEIATMTANPQNKMVITFDDGYCNVLENALEPLAHHGFHAIQFIVAGLIGQQNEWDVKHGDAPVALMDVAQIRDWLAAGHTIGSHSLTHRNLAKLDEAGAREQIFDSKKKLEDTFGVAIRHFCYPHGKWTPLVRELAGEAGYTTACTTEFGVNTAATPPFELRRINCLSRSEWLGKARHRVIKRLGLT